MRRARLITMIFLSSVLVYSCIFDENSMGPNQLPQIVSYRPEWQIATLHLPVDSVVLRIEAVDPENDPIRYTFVITDSTDSIDSVLSNADTTVFYARKSGIYNIQGRAYDSDQFSKHSWFIRVQEKMNNPPEITEWVPGSTVVQFIIGYLINFSITVEDDHPENLLYGYKINGSTIKPFSRDPDMEHRFLENGHYIVDGIVWDGEYGDTINWDITISGSPDTINPAGICDLNGVPGSESGTIHLDWTTPGDDGFDGHAAGYILRTSTVRISSEEAWYKANDYIGEPMPLASGVRDSMTLHGFNPGEMLYVCLRAYDEFNNLSPICSSPHLKVRGFDIEGKVIDAGSCDGIEGIQVLSNNIADTSLADGSYKLENLTSQATFVVTRDEYDPFSYGDYYDYIYSFGTISENLSANLCMVPVFPLIDAQDNRYLDFLDLFKQITKTTGINEGTVYSGWNHWPVTVYNPPVVCDDIDLQAAAEGAMEEWENITGLDLFRIVEDLAEADVEIRYDSTTVPDDYNHVSHHVETVTLNEDGTPLKKVMFISTLLTRPPITNDTHVIYTHEFGHVIGLYHSVDGGHIMIGLIFPKVEHVSTDESNLVKVIYNLPPVFDSEWITRN